MTYGAGSVSRDSSADSQRLDRKKSIGCASSRKKARPFERKAAFFVKKSDKKLTVPVCPKLSYQSKKPYPSPNYDNDPLKELELLQIPIGINERKPLHFNSGQKSKNGNVSANASTNASKSRANSRCNKSSSKPNSCKKTARLKGIGTHNDNFLSSFLSLRENEKKHDKPKLITSNIDDGWFNNIINVSFDSDLNPDEYQSIVMNLIPEFVNEARPKGVSSPGLKILDVNHIKAINNKDTETHQSRKATSDSLCNEVEMKSGLQPDSENEANFKTPIKSSQLKNPDDTCKVTKWRRDGFEAMIQDIKQEISNKNGETSLDSIFSIYDVPEDKDEDKKLQSLLKLDRIDEFIANEEQKLQ